MHSLRKTLEQAQQALQEAAVDHALIGGLALGNLGVHRATADVDMLIDGNKKEAAIAALKKVGFEVSVATDEVLHFTGAGTLDLLLANREPSQNMLKRATMSEPLSIKCVTPEDFIGLKIQAYKNNPKRAFQDKADIAALIERHPELDWKLVKYYADLFDEWRAIADIRKTYGL